MKSTDNEIFLVTGGSGFIGTNLIEDLSGRVEHIVNVDIAPPNDARHGAYWRKCDIMDHEGLDAIFAAVRPTHVLHLAARTDVEGKTLDDYIVNTQGTANVLTAVKRVATVRRLVVTSTQFVHQGERQPLHDEDYAPYTVYGESKIETEELTRRADLECVWTVVRPTNIWGPWHPRYPQEFWRIIGEGKYLHPGGEKVVRSYGYVGNVVWQIGQIIDAEPSVVAGKVFYVGDRPVDLREWVDGFSREQIGRGVIIVPRPLVRALALFGDLMKSLHLSFPLTTSRYRSMTTSNAAPMEETIRTFGEPPYSLAKGIGETVGWLKAHYPQLVPKHP